MPRNPYGKQLRQLRLLSTTSQHQARLFGGGQSKHVVKGVRYILLFELYCG